MFLSEWDGLTQGINAGPVVVLGATNRPLDLDQVRCCTLTFILLDDITIQYLILNKAFLRRLPVRVNIKMPDDLGRRQIFETILAKEKVLSI